MGISTLQQLLRSLIRDNPETEAVFLAQLASAQSRQAKNGSYLMTEWVDGTGSLSLRLWPGSQAHADLLGKESGGVYRVTGMFWRDEYGVSIGQPTLAAVNEEERRTFFCGGEQQISAAKELMDRLEQHIKDMQSVPLRLICNLALKRMGRSLSRAAAGRQNHHARLGGLLEHTVSMLEAAQGLVAHYPEAHADIVTSGILFHDLGKIKETAIPADSFVPKAELAGVLIGHIALGAQIFYNLWQETKSEHEKAFDGTQDSHLLEYVLHVIVSHHGSLEYGSPVIPVTPEGWIVHVVDLLDARMDMLRRTYSLGTPVNGLVEGQYPLPKIIPMPFKGAAGGT